MPSIVEKNVIKFEANLTIQEIEKVFTRLIELVEGLEGAISVDLGDVTSIDITGFQLIYSMNKSLDEKNLTARLLPLPSDHPVLIQSKRLGIQMEEFFELKKAL